MASFDMVIDTTPMALEINSVESKVQDTTGAVIAMQAAVVAQEKAAAALICHNVDNGFYILMKSQLSQKIASCASTMSSKILLMKKFRQDIEHIKHIMQDDYNRIYRRYKKQFTSLDNALKARVRQLDKFCMNICELYGKFFSAQKDCSASVISYESETQLPTVEATSAKVKNRTLNALSVMSSNVCNTISYTQKLSNILDNKSLSEKKETYTAVLLIQEQSMFDANSNVSNAYLPQTQNQNVAQNIFAQVQQQDANFAWENVKDSDYESVKTSYENIVSKAELDERVAKEMLRLFTQSKWQVPGKIISPSTKEEQL